MSDPFMQQAMSGMVGGGMPPGGAGGMVGGDPMAAGPSDEDLLMLVLSLIASGDLSGPGVAQVAEFVGADASMGDPMAGADSMMGAGMPAGGSAGGPMGGAPGGAPPVY